MRLFIAIKVPNEFHGHCVQLQSQFSGLKKALDFHLTLQFLGDNIKNTEAIIQTLSHIKFTPFEIELGNAVPFPDPFNSKGIWIECDPSSALLNLANEIRDAMQELGYIPDQPFRAHVTLGRYKETPTKKPFSIPSEPVRFRMDWFYLMESVLDGEGAKYKIISKFPIEGP